MNIKALKIKHSERKASNLPLQSATKDGIKGGRSTPADSDTKLSRLFDRVNNNFLNNSREVFNAWNPDKSKIFIYLKAIPDHLAKQFNAAKPEPLFLELIPIDSHEEDQYVDVSKIEEHGNKQIQSKP